MKKIFRITLLAVLFAAFLGFAALAEGETRTDSTVSPGNGSTTQPTPSPSPSPSPSPEKPGGNTNPTNPSTPSGDVPGSAGASSCGVSNSFDKDLEGMIGGTPVGGVIQVTKEDGRNSLDLDMLKKAVDRDLTLVMEYTYSGADYRIVIPGKKAAIDESVPIYGPLYLAAHYSSNAAVGGSTNGVTYTIAKGDTLSKIAATNGTTVAALAALNPQIKDINVIYTGQSINLK